jgi:hypothetical protein
MNHTSYPNEKTIPRTKKRATPDHQEEVAHGRDSGGRSTQKFPALRLAVVARRAAVVIAWADCRRPAP